MKRSKLPTSHLIIKANTRAEYDPINYAIIHITAEWLEWLRHRLTTIETYLAPVDFHCFSYWDSPMGYFYIADHLINKYDLMPRHEDQAFISLEDGDLEVFCPAENRLEAQQLITRGGIAHFKAYAYGSGEEYWTEEFNLHRLLKQCSVIFSDEKSVS